MKAGIDWAKVNFGKINQVQLADAHGVSDKTIRRWQKEGDLPRNVDGSYDLAKTIAWRERAYDRELRSLNMNRARDPYNYGYAPALPPRLARQRHRHFRSH